MRNYYGEMQDRLNKYRVVHMKHPRVAVLKSLLWNMFFLIKLPQGDEDEWMEYVQRPVMEIDQKEEPQQLETDHDIFCLALVEGGGLGDALLDTQLLKAINEISTKSIKIDFYCRNYQMFHGYPFIDGTFSYSDSIDKSKYDLILIGHRFMIINHMCDDRVRDYSPLLFEYCCDMRKLVEHDLSNTLNDNIISQYALIKGKNRIEQCNINDILPMDRYSGKYMPINADEFFILEKYGLLGRKYIVFNTEVDGKYDNNHPKLWALEKYNRLIRRIKLNYPDILVVQVGTSDIFDILSLVDIDLVGKTNLEQCKIILKYSLLLVASEGGLVHMKNFLYGKSVVIFGPTIPEIFGYEENINIRSNACPHTCEWVTDKWTDKCILGYPDPICTGGVGVEEVYKAVADILEDKEDYQYSIMQYHETLSVKIFRNLLKNKNLYICSVGTVPEVLIKEILGHNCRLDCYVEQGKIRERCYKIREIYGNQYNIPAYDNTYDITFLHDTYRDKFWLFSIAELLRVTKVGGIVVIVVKKVNVSLVVEALTELNMQIEYDRIKLGKDCTLVIKKEKYHEEKTCIFSGNNS